MKNHTQNVVQKLFPDSVIKSRNWAYLWPNSLKFYTVCFHYVPSEDRRFYWKLLQSTCFYLISSFFKKQKEVLNYLFLPEGWEFDFKTLNVRKADAMKISGL